MNISSAKDIWYELNRINLLNKRIFEIPQSLSGPMIFKLVDDYCVFICLGKISSKAVGGDDGLPIQFIKMCCPYILEHKVFPECWKMAILRAISKITSLVDYKDLRPISKLVVLSKVLDRIIKVQLNEYVDQHNIVPLISPVFEKKNYSCLTTLFSISHT